MNASKPDLLPATITQYLEQLRSALAGADPALVQDALYDAEEYLRSEWAEHPQMSESALLASVAGSYGAPAEVADIYRDTEATVTQALRTPAPPPRRSFAGKVFGVFADGRAYGALLYMLLSIVTGLFYFTWAVTGLSLTIGLAVLIIGIPFAILFFASVRGLALLEGRLVEVMLGERMPRRPAYADREQPLLKRIGTMFSDPRTWSTLCYQLLMLPLGIVYFTVAVTALSLSLSIALAPVVEAIAGHPAMWITWDDYSFSLPLWTTPLTMLVGLTLLLLTLHGARGIGAVHGAIAKHLLVRGA
jgi:uncharacterized membrane protein